MDNKPIIFFHIAFIGKFQCVVNEMVGAMIACGLWEEAQVINLGVAPVLGQNLSCWWGLIGLHTDWRIEKLDLNEGEAATLKHLRTVAANNPNHPFLYVHTKGVSAGADNDNVDQWRRMMSYFCITRWRDCLELLKTNDTVGIDFRRDYAPHYSGNFWWARGRYIATLPEVADLPVILSERHKAEFWIGSGIGSHHSMYDSGAPVLERHLKPYPRETYAT